MKTLYIFISIIFDSDDVVNEYIFLTNNGALIGILEGFLIAVGLLFQNTVFIGIILAIRSYVAVTSLSNKEESEFYIIGMLGPLLITIIFTGLYILSIHALLDIDILKEIVDIMPKYQVELF